MNSLTLRWFDKMDELQSERLRLQSKLDHVTREIKRFEEMKPKLDEYEVLMEFITRLDDPPLNRVISDSSEQTITEEKK